MSEIKRVFTAVEAFFDASGIEKIEQLGETLLKTVGKAERRLAETANGMKLSDFKDRLAPIEALKSRIAEAIAAARGLPKATNIEVFQGFAKEAMMLRRAGYPLTNPEAAYLPDLTPEEALLRDDDAYAFAIFDTLAEDIQFTLPPLFGLACEGDDWGDDQASPQD